MPVENWNTDVYDLKDGLKDTYFSRNNIESDNFIKGDVVYKFSPNLEFSAGINTKYGEYNMQEVIDPDTVYLYNYPEFGNVDLNDYNDYYELIQKHPIVRGLIV